MKIILDSDQHPKGIYFPLDEWEKFKHHINSSSDLYKLMDELSHQDVFDMDKAEFADYLLPVAENAAKKALDQGLYFSYPAGDDVPGAFIHEYLNGKKILVEIDETTGKEHFLKQL
ncbi:MAG: hypothetical protein JWQ66_4465 [Mucilaginibacter sp.]|nr:hypothetical protein [Mucilaginibacter sp.]